jgi:hypothetical protein
MLSAAAEKVMAPPSKEDISKFILGLTSGRNFVAYELTDPPEKFKQSTIYLFFSETVSNFIILLF